MERRRTIIGDETIDMNNKAFELLAEINVSDYGKANSVMLQKSIDCSELILVWEDIKNSTTANSFIRVLINNQRIECGQILSGGNTALSGYSRIELLEGVGTIGTNTTGALLKTNYRGNGSAYEHQYNLFPITERFFDLKIMNVETQYYAVSGTIKVYGR